MKHRITINQNAAANTRYAHKAFDGMIGRELPFVGAGLDAAKGRLVQAEVADDGTSFQLTFEVDEAVAAVATAGDFSVGLHPFADAIWLQSPPT